MCLSFQAPLVTLCWPRPLLPWMFLKGRGPPSPAGPAKVSEHLAIVICTGTNRNQVSRPNSSIYVHPTKYLGSQPGSVAVDLGQTSPSKSILWRRRMLQPISVSKVMRILPQCSRAKQKPGVAAHWGCLSILSYSLTSQHRALGLFGKISQIMKQVL